MRHSRVTDQRLEQEKQAEKAILLSWLCPESFHISYSDHRDDFLEGTGSWLLRSQTYNDWKYNTDSDLLWIKGTPGCGKSILTTTVIDLDLKVEMGSLVGLAYAFCRRDNDAKQSASLIFRALCKEVAQQMPEVDSELQSLYRSPQQQDELAIKNVRKVFSSVLSNFATTFLVVDALDECQDVEQRLRLVKELVTLVSGPSGRTVKVLVSSRQDAQLGNLLDQYKCIDPREHNSEDLEAYIDHRFAHIGGDEGDPQVDNDIRNACVERAEGMFLWVKLISSSFENQSLSPKQMLNKIKAVPAGLKSVYETMFDLMWRQDEEQRADALLVLLWVLHARRPLTGEELLEAVIDYSDFTWRQEAKSSMQKSAAKLVSKCANLVYIDGEDYVRFCHTSLEDHLKGTHATSTEPLLAFQRLETTVHERLAEICLKFLLLKDFECGPAKNEKGLTTLLIGAPFLEYAAKNWGWHAAQQTSETVTHCVKALVRSVNRRELSMQIHLYHPSEETNHWQFVKRSSPLHILSAFGLNEIAATWPNIASMVVKPDASGSTPLDYALLGNHAEMCLWLMQTSKSENAGQLGPEKRVGAIHRAAALGWTPVLRLLLIDNQSLVNCKMVGDGATPLTRACTAGKIDAVEALIDHGADLNLEDGEGDTPLIMSTLMGHPHITDLLLERGAEVSCRDVTGHTPLHYAVMHGDYEVAMALMTRKPDLIMSTTIGEEATPVHFAAGAGAVDILAAMYDLQPNFTTKTKNGSTPLHEAARHNRYGAVNALLTFEVPKDEVDANGETALFIAAEEQHWQIVQLLLEFGCAIEVEDIYGQTAVHAAAIGGSEKVLEYLLEELPFHVCERILNKKNTAEEAPLHIAITEGNSKIAKLLLSRGADPCLPGRVDATPLHYVAHYRGPTLVSTILGYTKNASPRDRNEDTPLHYAARASNLAFVQELLDACDRFSIAFDAKTTNKFQRCSLLIALEEQCQSIAEILVEHDTTSFPDSSGDYPIHVAAWYGYEAVVAKLLQRPGNVEQGYFGRTPLACAALRGHLATVQLLHSVSQGVLDVPDEKGATPLMRALQCEHLEVVDYLIGVGADCKAVDNFGSTLLHAAADIDNLSLVKRLLAQGCNSAAFSQYGHSVFHRAVRIGSADIVDELLKLDVNHAKIPSKIGDYCTFLAASNGNLGMLKKLDELEVQYQSQNCFGRTALFEAASSGYWELLDFLMAHGEDPTLKDREGWTAIRLAASEGYPMTVGYLAAAITVHHQTLCSEILDTALLTAVGQCRLHSVHVLLAAGSNPTKLDELGLNALDYASQYLPLQKIMLRTGHLRNPNTREIEGRILRETIKAGCEFIISFTDTESVPERYSRHTKLIMLFEALRRVKDFENAKTCAMELMWHLDSDLIEVEYSCGLCGRTSFDGDRMYCKSCYFPTVLCCRCHEDYVEAGHEAPPAFTRISCLEGIVRPVRMALDDEFSLGEIWYAMVYFVDGYQWMSTMTELYDVWEHKWNSKQRYRGLRRPGQELLKMAKQAGQYLIKTRADARDRSQFSKLMKKFKSYRVDEEFARFPCQNHEYFAIKNSDRAAALENGKYLDPKSGRVNSTWAEEVLAKYSNISVTEKRRKSGMEPNRGAFTADDVSLGNFSRLGDTNRSLTGRPWRGASGDDEDLLSALIAQNPDLRSSMAGKENEDLRQVRRAKTLPIHMPIIITGATEEMKIEVKDASVIAAATAALEAPASQESSGVGCDAIFGTSSHRTLSVSAVDPETELAQRSNVIHGEPNGDNGDTSASESGGGKIFPQTLIAEPESFVEAEAGPTEADLVGEPNEVPVAVITAASGPRKGDGDNASDANHSDRVLEIAYRILHSDPGTERNLQLWKFAVKITQVMDPQFTSKLMRLLRSKGVVIAPDRPFG